VFGVSVQLRFVNWWNAPVLVLRMELLNVTAASELPSLK
jgi:hypothetical protein